MTLSLSPAGARRVQILAFLRAHPGTSTQGVADNIREPKSTVYESLAYLERVGKVVRVPGKTGSHLHPTVWSVRRD